MNKNELRAQMARHGDTGQTLAEALNIAVTSMSEKLNGKRDFTQSEISAIKRRYSLSPDEVDAIFFDFEVE